MASHTHTHSLLRVKQLGLRLPCLPCLHQQVHVIPVCLSVPSRDRSTRLSKTICIRNSCLLLFYYYLLTCLPICDTTGTEDRTFEHTLSMHLIPSTSQLHYARLEPPSVDISAAVDFARWHPSSLQLLVCSVRGLLRTYWRRQIQIEGEWGGTNSRSPQR